MKKILNEKLMKKKLLKQNNKKSTRNNNNIKIVIDNSRKTTSRKNNNNSSKFKQPQLYTPNFFPNPANNFTNELSIIKHEMFKQQDEHANKLKKMNDTLLLNYDPNYKNEITSKLETIQNSTNNK